MKKAVLLLSVFLAGIQVMAQQLFFIAIDADQQQPFAVLMGKKSYSSNGQGHLILSGLKDSSYELTISFPKNIYPDQVIKVEMKKKDRGFQLKKINANTWGLYDWQTMELLKPGTAQTQGSYDSKETRTDAFAILMAGVVNDTSVLIKTVSRPVAKASPEKKVPVKDTSTKTAAPEKAIVKTEAKPFIPVISPPVDTKPVLSVNIKEDSVKEAIVETKKADTVRAIVKMDNRISDTASKMPMAVITPAEKKKDIVLIQKDTIVAIPVTPKEAVPDIPQTVIKKVFDNTGKETRALIFRDSSSLGVDTIRIKIDLETGTKEPEAKLPVEEKPAESEVNKSEKKAELLVRTEEEAKEGKRPADTLMVSKPSIINKPDTVQQTIVEPVKQDTVASPRKLMMVNSDCVNKATDADLDKLRVKMLAATTTEDRIMVARKAFKAKCYYTRQIKALTELFLSDETRYQFFDAAYPFVIDTDEFKGLVKLLTEDYYINRFKAMVRY